MVRHESSYPIFQYSCVVLLLEVLHLGLLLLDSFLPRRRCQIHQFWNNTSYNEGFLSSSDTTRRRFVHSFDVGPTSAKLITLNRRWPIVRNQILHLCQHSADGRNPTPAVLIFVDVGSTLLTRHQGSWKLRLYLHPYHWEWNTTNIPSHVILLNDSVRYHTFITYLHKIILLFVRHHVNWSSWILSHWYMLCAKVSIFRSILLLLHLTGAVSIFSQLKIE